MQEKPINFVLCWHMHQPWYQQGIDGDYQLPWVYLHAIKDYTDMAAHLENHPHMHVVVNFAPILLEQLDDYAVQLKEWFNEGRAMRDPLLNSLAGVTPVPDTATGRYEILITCQRAHAPRMIDPYPCFREMLDMVALPDSDESPEPESLKQLHYLNEQYFYDLLVWYHLSWLGYSLKQMPEVQQLMNKGRLYDEQDRRLLLKIIMDSIVEVIPRYRRLAESGQIELSMTPYCHPIIPLLNDFSNMSCAQPDAPVPDCGGYPDGVARSRWHIEQGITCFERHFGIRPSGVWLSEGGISDDAISLLDEYGFAWTATGEGVWHNSCHASGFEPDLIHSKHDLFSPHIVDGHKARVFFRDDGLSDLIGFEYSDRDATDAVNDFRQHLTNITNLYGDKADQHVISVILDGENAWEYYPDNGFHFIDTLYRELGKHDQVNTTTFSALQSLPCDKSLPKLCAGSWVYGTFSTWIGEHDKNLAWDRLVEAKLAYDRVISSGRLDEVQHEKANRQMAVCEGSDWFWWFGDHNPSDSVNDFDRLFRLQLKSLYHLLQESVPDILDVPISHGGGQAENAGTMRRN